MICEETRREVHRITIRLYEEGMIHLSAGNVSLRVSPELVAITPTGIPYSQLQPEDVVIVDLQGQVVEGHYQPSSEAPMHTQVLKERPDVSCIVHSHSPYATAFAVIGRGIPVICTEGLIVRGPVAVAEYACPGSAHAGALALKALEGPPRVNGILLRNHGALAIGKDAEEAFNVACRIEISAHIYHLALQVGQPIALTDEQIAEIKATYAAR